MKLSLKKAWFCRVLQDLSPTATGACRGIVGNGMTKYGHLDHLPLAVKLACMVFAIIGALGTLRWTTTVLFASPNIVSEDHTPEECIPNDAIDELAYRMNLLEVAFKEQAFARETITREITDQSDVYMLLDRKLDAFVEQLNDISTRYAELEDKYTDLSERVHSHEMLGVVLLLVFIAQLVFTYRSRIKESIGHIDLQHLPPSLSNYIHTSDTDSRSSSTPSTPKHGPGLRNEICVVCFTRDQASGAVHRLTDAMLRHLDGIKLSFKPCYTIFSQDDIRSMPNVKLYVLVVDLESRGHYINGMERDLVVATIKHTKSLGANCVVVMANDEGSKNMTSHSVYNTSIRLCKTHDCIQDLAANGKLFSMWQDLTSHQLSHLRRFVKTVLNAKLVLR